MNRYFKLIISILIPLLIGFAGSYFTTSTVSTWYTTLQKASFNPPNWIFGPVWTVLYIMIGLSFYFIWKVHPITGFKYAFWIYVIQLILNFTWSVLFFGLKNPLLAFIEIILLWLTIIMLIFSFNKLSKISSYLLIPYLLWVTFAAILNLSIVILNR